MIGLYLKDLNLIQLNLPQMYMFYYVNTINFLPHSCRNIFYRHRERKNVEAKVFLKNDIMILPPDHKLVIHPDMTQQ